jgi:hypothetical protein
VRLPEPCIASLFLPAQSAACACVCVRPVGGDLSSPTLYPCAAVTNRWATMSISCRRQQTAPGRCSKILLILAVWRSKFANSSRRRVGFVNTVALDIVWLWKCKQWRPVQYADQSYATLQQPTRNGEQHSQPTSS